MVVKNLKNVYYGHKRNKKEYRMQEEPIIKRNSPVAFLAGAVSVAVLTVLTYLIVLLIGNISANTTKSAMYSNVKKIAPYLYEISYTDYRIDENSDTHKTAEAFGCSSVHNGNYYGRNYDYIFNDTPEFIVRVSKTDTRHASIGVATHYGLRENLMERGEYDEQLELIPNFTLDGINDAGVIASINVVPGEPDTGKLTGTNPDGEDLDMAFVVRYILDNADSAEHAVELLKSRNLYGTAVDDMYLHVMIADANKTYIVEPIDNQMVAMEKTGNEQIMTNFYTNLPGLTEHAAGVERYAILQENYDEGSTLVGMRDLMKRVKYSNAYNYANYPVWYSESIPQSLINNQNSPEFAGYLEIYEDIQKDYWNYITNDIRNPANGAFWHTTHNSVYDIEKRMIRVTVQEDYSNYYDFTL